MAMFDAVSGMFSADKAAPSEPAATETAKDDEIATLKAQLAALQAKFWIVWASYPKIFLVVIFTQRWKKAPSTPLSGWVLMMI